jgi:DNA replication protein DnaC
MGLKRDMEKEMRARGVPESFLYFRQGDKLHVADKLIEQAFAEGKGLLLSGPPGTGKTLTLARFAHELTRRGAGVAFEFVPDLVNKLKFSLSNRTDVCSNRTDVSYWNRIEFLASVRHLFLDDLGAETDTTGWWTTMLHNTLDRRSTSRLFTSASINNVSRLSGAILRRLQEHCVVVQFEEGE